MTALVHGHGDDSLKKNYFFARAICCKSELDYDLFEQCFLEYFDGVEVPSEVREKFFEYMKNPKAPRKLSQEQKKS